MLSSMYNKIELAYAMGEINDAIRNDLLVLNKLRNLFAHPREGRVRLHSVEARSILKTFSGYEKEMDAHAFFLKKIQDCMNAMWTKVARIETAKGHAPQGGTGRQEMRSWVPMITDQ